MHLLASQKSKLSHPPQQSFSIPKLEGILATHELPKFAETDNGPAFPVVHFYKFMKELRANHSTTSTYWPQVNTEVERFMSKLSKQQI